jgi:hypothetical protein
MVTDKRVRIIWFKKNPNFLITSYFPIRNSQINEAFLRTYKRIDKLGLISR